MAIHADTRDLDRLAIAFKAAPKEIRSAHRKRLKSAVKVTVDDAKRRIAPHSPKVAATVRSGARGANKVVLQAGNKGLVLAILEEHQGWRHPLFGNDEHWYAQRGHPYMRPAWKATKGEVIDDLGDAVREGMRDLGISSERR